MDRAGLLEHRDGHSGLVAKVISSGTPPHGACRGRSSILGQIQAAVDEACPAAVA